ncbi:hypothetical protein BJY52DRAFT_1378162, partial [Lactarius psammicola]
SNPRLDHFIAYTFHRTRLHLCTPSNVSRCSPTAKGSSGHHLFISAFMLASKIICDDTYSNKSWCIIGQGMFALQEIYQILQCLKMCLYLEWQLNIDPSTLHDFESRVRHDFAGPWPYPTVVLLP